MPDVLGMALGVSLLAATDVACAAESAVHGDPVASVGLALVIILTSAKLGGELATRAGQPAVLGELVVGVILGNLPLLNISVFAHIATDQFVDMLARLGVLILLFEVGLESTVGQMLKVGLSSFLVALLGVLAPFALGWGVGIWLLPAQTSYVHMFLGATLTATSVGITARVLKDLGASQSDEGRIILGAAVIDDVMGLVILAGVTAVIAAANTGTTLSYVAIGVALGEAVGFLIVSVVLGMWLAPALFSAASRLRSHGVLLAVGLAFCFALSWLATLVGLAAIVGAFAAGLILEGSHYADFVGRGERGLEDLISPISSFLVPIFFVLMGMRTDLHSFQQPGMLGLAAALTLAAVVGKQVCAFGVVGRGIDRLTVGIGMIPRGEVGLIFANIGLTLSLGGTRIIDQATFSAVVVMVIATTVVTPPALQWSLARTARRARTRAARYPPSVRR
jgi:Kef-type K+ transport system membrane component KefB